MTRELVESRRNPRGGAKVLKKYELLGEKAPVLFAQVESWVLEVSKKRYKSLKHIVRLLVEKTEESGLDRRTEDLVKVRAFFRWCTENIR